MKHHSSSEITDAYVYARTDDAYVYARTDARIDALQEYLAAELARIQGQLCSVNGLINRSVVEQMLPHYLKAMKEADEDARD